LRSWLGSGLRPGPNGLSVWDSTLAFKNLQVADSGLVTLRNGLVIPASATSAVPPTSWGTVATKIDDQSPSGVSSITIPASGTIPSGFRTLRIDWVVRTTSGNNNDSVLMQFNGDTGAHYNFQLRDSVGTTISTAATSSATSVLAGTAAGGALGSIYANVGYIELLQVAGSTWAKKGWCWCMRNDISAFGIRESGWEWAPPTQAAISTITLAVAAGNYASGSQVVTRAMP
ncbi:MAG TPA: hypothetical protein VG476_04825, partial [Acidimicrobiales bacterium]|nr:hypothetical protein [Acidimicrobiales bacterium]